MAEPNNIKTLSSTSAMEEKVELYALAVCGLFDRMLSYAGVVHETNRDNYMEMRALVNHIYSGYSFGFNLRKKLSDGSKRETILAALENEYKQECAIYKEAFFESLNANFENELNAQFDGNTLPDMNDRLAFSALRKSAGKRVHSKLVSLAAEGSVEAQLQAGKNYFLGWGTPVDFDAGLHWLGKAANAGDAEALLYLGLAYETVHDVTTGYRLNPESIKCYEAAYAKGNPMAPYALYRFYKNHLTDKPSRSSAKKWLRRGKEEGCIPCLYSDESLRPDKPWALGNTRNAVKWIEAAASLGEVDAFRLLETLYTTGRAGLEKNEEKAEECAMRALELS